MTVSNQTNRTSAVGNAAIGQEVAFTFPYNATSDLTVISRVTLTGVETTLAETTNYTLTAASETGGTLTTVTAVAATSQIHIIRDTPMTQSLDLEQGGSFNAENIEDALDKNTKLNIENSDSVSRVMTFPKTDPTASLGDMPNSIDRAGKTLSFDSDGKPNATASAATGTVAFSALGEDLAAAVTSTTARALLDLDTSDIAKNATKFTVTAASGNTATEGTLSVGSTLTVTGASTFNDDINLGAGDDLVGSATSKILINGDKFTVDGSNGNTVVAGTLDVTGVSTLTGNTTVGGTLGVTGIATLGLGAGSVATTQAITDTSTKIATTAYVTNTKLEKTINMLSSTTGCDLAAAITTETPLYTVPTAKIMIVDHIVMHTFSADPGNGTVEFGTAGACTDYLTAQNYTNLTAAFATQSLRLTVIPTATTAVQGTYAAGVVFAMEIVNAADSACTCTIEVWGHLIDA